MKHRQIWLVLLATIGIGLALPLGIGFLMNLQWSGPPVAALVMIFCLCLGWPGYSLWLSLWACRDIRHRWFLPPLFHVLLACTCGAWLYQLWFIGVAACGIMLVISVIVMFVTVSSGTKQ